MGYWKNGVYYNVMITPPNDLTRLMVAAKRKQIREIREELRDAIRQGDAERIRELRDYLAELR